MFRSLVLWPEPSSAFRVHGHGGQDLSPQWPTLVRALARHRSLLLTQAFRPGVGRL